jgi:hypothetical protein
MFSKTKIQLLWLAAALMIACTTIPAQGAGQTLEGAWLISISVDGQQGPVAIDMAVFDSKGSYRIIPSNKGESEGAGAFQRTGNREFRSTHTQALYDPQGNFAGIAKVIAIEKVDESGVALTGTYRVDVLNAAGAVIKQFTGTITGKLVVPERL